MNSNRARIFNVFALVSGLVVAMYVSSARAGESGAIVLFPLENRAQLSQDEVATLSNAVSARFLEKAGADGVVVIANDDEGDVCDEACVRTRAMEVGAGVAVTGVVKTFGEAFIVELVATEPETGKLIGRGNTPPAADLVELLSETQKLAEKFIGRLLQVSAGGSGAQGSPVSTKVYPDRTKPVPVPDRDTSYGMAGYGVAASSDSAVIHVTSKPSGATVRIGGVFSGPVVGKTPLSKHLKPGIYTVSVDKAGFSRKKMRFRLHMGDSKDLHFKLDPYVMLLGIGHAAFWAGLLVEIPGLVMLASDSDPSIYAPLCIGGGVLVATAITLWIVRGVKISRYNKKRTQVQRGLTILPSKDQGVAVAYAQTF